MFQGVNWPLQGQANRNRFFFKVMGTLRRILQMAVGLGEGINGTLRDAQAGDASAQFYLGFYHERGQHGLPQDYFESAKWYLKAAEQDHHAAQLYLGILLIKGTGVEQNVVEALKWIMLAKRGGRGIATLPTKHKSGSRL